jgi:hypothetical protein
VLACCLSLAILAIGQESELPSPTPVPFTAEPRQTQWRIGFDLGNAVILETPELNPDNDIKQALREAQRILPNPFLDFGLALLPFSKVSVRTPQLVNPRQWTIVDLHGRTSKRTFQTLGVFMGRRLASTEGGYHLVSTAATATAPFLGVRKEPATEDVIFGFAGPKGKTQIHTKLSETKWENLLPVEDPENLPAGYETAKQLLDDQPAEGPQRYLYGTSIEALIRNHVSKLWLLNYSNPDTTAGRHPWGIFVEQDGHLQPQYVHRPQDSEEAFVAYFTAAVDLNQDGTDELVIEASYRIGTAYKVVANVGGKYQQTFSSYYRGPAS